MEAAGCFVALTRGYKRAADQLEPDGKRRNCDATEIITQEKSLVCSYGPMVAIVQLGSHPATVGSAGQPKRRVI